MNTIPANLMMPSRTITGLGSACGLLNECVIYGNNGLLVHGRSLKECGVIDSILELKPELLTVKTWEHPGGEPTLKNLEDLLHRLYSFDGIMNPL